MFVLVDFWSLSVYYDAIRESSQQHLIFPLTGYESIEERAVSDGKEWTLTAKFNNAQSVFKTIWLIRNNSEVKFSFVVSNFSLPAVPPGVAPLISVNTQTLTKSRFYDRLLPAACRFGQFTDENGVIRIRQFVRFGNIRSKIQFPSFGYFYSRLCRVSVRARTRKRTSRLR